MAGRFERRQYATPLLIERMDPSRDRMDRSDPVHKLVKLSFASTNGATSYDEGWLQELIHDFPQSLPVTELEPGFTRLAPVCLELPTPAGYVDNLFVTSTGDLVLAECKLWRNPEARRQVVAQIIDYAHCMADWTYQDLEAAVRQGILPDRSKPTDSLFEIAGAAEDIDEPGFVDAVTKNLRRGRMLLLIVGDGIREGVETLTDYLQMHAGFHFTLGMVEMALYGMPKDGGVIVLPRVLARTVNIERGIVRLEDSRLTVRAADKEPGAQTGGRRTNISEERFFEMLSETDPGLPGRLRTFLERADALGVFPEFSQSLNLKWIGPGDRKYNLGTITTAGDVRTHPVNWVADSIGRIDLAHGYLDNLARIIDGHVRPTRMPAGRYVVTEGTKLPKIAMLLAKEERWLSAIEAYTAELRKATAGEEA